MSKESKQSVAESTSVATSGFVGRYDYALDPKKRFTIPSLWRGIMGNPEFVYVMPDPKERCVNIIPPVEMESRLSELRKKALFDPALRPVLQKIGACSEMPSVDVQGRIRISDKLLQFANLTTTVAMQGAVRMIQLWDPAVLPPAEKVDQEGLGEALALAGF
jgi:division/cell wall cluster transcriptional repressor MraZ